MKVLTSPCRLTIAALVVVAVFVASNGGIDRAAANSPIKIVSVAFSDPNSDHLWQSSRDLDITVTLNQATTVDSGSLVGTSSQELGDGFQCQLQDGKVADYAFYRSGNGTNQLVFRCRLVGPPRTRVFIQENSMHLVNPGPGTYLNFHPRFIRTSDTHDLSGPTVTSINTNQAPSDGLWAGGDRVDVNVTFSENVNVTTRNNNPYIIVIEKTTNGSQAHQYRYRTGSGTRTITFSRTLPSDIIPRHSIFLVADRFRHGNGYIVASANKALADLSHAGGTIGGVFTPWCIEQGGISPRAETTRRIVLRQGHRFQRRTERHASERRIKGRQSHQRRPRQSRIHQRRRPERMEDHHHARRNG